MQEKVYQQMFVNANETIIFLASCGMQTHVLLELSSALRRRRPLKPCSWSCTGFQCNNVWPTRSVFWGTRPCRTETSVSALLTDSLRTSSMLAIEGTFLVDQEPCQYGSSLARRSGIPHLKPETDWLWILVVQLHSVLLKTFKDRTIYIRFQSICALLCASESSYRVKHCTLILVLKRVIFLLRRKRWLFIRDLRNHHLTLMIYLTIVPSQP